MTVEAEGEFAIFNQELVNRMALSRRRSSEDGRGRRAESGVEARPKPRGPASSRRGSSSRPVARQSLQPSRNPADYPFTHRLRTRFAETDAMGIIHHAAYLPYLEEARVEYLRAVGHPYDSVRAGDPTASGDRDGGRDFAVLEVSVHYRKPLRFDDEVDVALVIGAVTGTTFQIAYLLSVGGEARATAVTVHGCVDGRGGRHACRPGSAEFEGGVATAFARDLPALPRTAGGDPPDASGGTVGVVQQVFGPFHPPPGQVSSPASRRRHP